MMSKAIGFEVSTFVAGKDAIELVISDCEGIVLESEFTLDEVIEIGEALAKAAKEAIRA